MLDTKGLECMYDPFYQQGGSGGELALFVRLYVLEAVCTYHKGDIFGTAKCLDKVQFEIDFHSVLPQSSFFCFVT